MEVKVLLPDSSFSRAKYELLKDERIGTSTVHKGFVSDGATVPRILWSVFPPVSKHFPAVVLHDYLLKTRGYSQDSWAIANKAMEYEMLNLGVHKVVRLAFKFGVEFNKFKYKIINVF